MPYPKGYFYHKAKFFPAYSIVPVWVWHGEFFRINFAIEKYIFPIGDFSTFQVLEM